MEFNQLLEHFDEDAGQKEKIALAIYCHEGQQNPPKIKPRTVKLAVQRSRASISISSVSTYLRRLQKKEWIKPIEDDSYRLTHTGRDQVEVLLDGEALDNPRDEEDRFLNMDNFDEDERYAKLVEDVNKSYQYRIYDATMVLTRKFFEDIVFEILKTHYAGDDVQMFYDQENSQHHSFDDLLSNFKDGVPALRRYSRELEREMVEELRDLKNEGNTGAHSIRVDFTDEEVEDWSSEATMIAEVFYDVLLGARIADEEHD